MDLTFWLAPLHERFLVILSAIRHLMAKGVVASAREYRCLERLLTSPIASAIVQKYCSFNGLSRIQTQFSRS